MEMLHIVKTRQCLCPMLQPGRARPLSSLGGWRLGPGHWLVPGLISGLCISAARSHTPQGHHSININNADTRGVSLRGLRCPPPAAECSRLPDVQVVTIMTPWHWPRLLRIGLRLGAAHHAHHHSALEHKPRQPWAVRNMKAEMLANERKPWQPPKPSEYWPIRGQCWWWPWCVQDRSAVWTRRRGRLPVWASVTTISWWLSRPRRTSPITTWSTKLMM